MLAVVLAAFVCAAPAYAQGSASTGSIAGIIADASGAPIARAAVRATNLDVGQSWTAVSDADGRFRLLALPLGRYRVAADAPGFESASRELTLALGQTLDVPLTLAVAGVSEAVTVSAAPPLVDVVRTETAQSVSLHEVRDLPLNGRNYLDLALLTPGVSRTNTGTPQRFAETSAVPGTGISISSQRNLNNAFVVDGLSANDDAAGLAGTFYSQEVIREFNVISSGAEAQFGRASSGFIDIVTQSGTNDVHGAAYGFFRDAALDARNPLSRRTEPLSQQQWGATYGGPLRRDRTFLFTNVESTRNRRTGLITIDPAAADAINARMFGVTGERPIATGAFPTGFTTLNVFARVDHAWSAATRSYARYSAYHVTSPNARNVGGLNTITRGSVLDNLDQTAAFSLTSTIGATLLHELRGQATRSRLDAPVNDERGPAINVAGVANMGTATFSPTARALDVYEMADTLTIQRGRHLVKTGADVLLNRVAVTFPGAIAGVYTFGSLDDFLAGRYVTYQQAFGDPRQFQSNPNVGLFAQDEWRLTSTVTINAGVRYDLQGLPDPIRTDANNLSPRAGLAWAPGDHRTVVRASAGLFFDRLPLRATSNALQRDGVRYRVAVLPGDDPRAPAFPDRLAAFPDGLLTSINSIDPGIQDASSRQVAVAVERAVGGDASLEVGYQHVTGRGLIMSRNVNVPTLTAAEAERLGVPNLGRPDSRLANDVRYESIGRSSYDALSVSGTWRRGAGSLRLSYTLSRALDDAGNFFFSQPQDAGDVHADWGPSDNDQRHRLTVSGSLQTPDRLAPIWRDWQVSGMFSAASALPFNVVTGVDDNHDTNVNDRPAGVGRNSERAFGFATLDVRVARSVRFAGIETEFMADVFNVLNRSNLTLPNGVFGTGTTPLPSFGRATAAMDPRQIQLGVRVAF
ncbi:MAG TPA: carboxypeptidase regulatory-like domain-containing protein [Vicinamibacterales bacterium]|nr:carboxypeptidase regulatory-like domain-containing protein [Vicinamibacterales bacterium]